MRWRDQNGTRRVSHYLLRDAPDQYMFQTGQPVRRGDDQIDIVLFRKGANIYGRRATGKDRVKFCASELYRPHKLSHLAVGIFAGSLLQGGNVIEGSALARIDVSEISGMQQNDPVSKFIGESNRVPEGFPRRMGEIHWHKDCLNTKS